MHLFKTNKQTTTTKKPQNQTKTPKPTKLKQTKQNQKLFYNFISPRESIYRLLPQTTPENVSKNFSHYSIDPATRYPNINVNFLRPQQVTGQTLLLRVCHLHCLSLGEAVIMFWEQIVTWCVSIVWKQWEKRHQSRADLCTLTNSCLGICELASFNLAVVIHEMCTRVCVPAHVYIPSEMIQCSSLSLQFGIHWAAAVS